MTSDSRLYEQVPACDLCGSDSYRTLFVKEGFAHVRCSGCGLVFVNPRLKDHIELQTEGGTGSMGEDSITDRQRGRLARDLSGISAFRKLNRILEIGPGKGWFLAEANASGWETWASEINLDAIESLRNKGVTKIISTPAETLDVPEEHFDVVRMWDVIEHLRSPNTAVRRVFKALRPGGLFWLATTNFASLSRRVNGPEWVYLNGADHIILFEPATITRLLEQTGFKNIRIRTRSFNLRRKLYHPPQELPPGSRAIRPFRKIVDEVMRFTMLGHQMIVEGAKPHSRS